MDRFTYDPGVVPSESPVRPGPGPTSLSHTTAHRPSAVHHRTPVPNVNFLDPPSSRSPAPRPPSDRTGVDLTP